MNRYRMHINERTMYYVEPNIIRPLTVPHQVSYAELAGTVDVVYFVSHFWGTPFRHFVETLECHARATRGAEWEELSFWICSFSNNQWQIKDDIPDGDWRCSSFYLALTSETYVA